MLQATGQVRASKVRELAVEIKRRRLRHIRDTAVTQPVVAPGKNWAAKFLNDHCHELKIRNLPGIAWVMIIGDFVASASDIEQLCSKCASINIRLETELSRSPNVTRKIHTFEHSSNNTRGAQCKLCRFVENCAWDWDWPAADKFSLQIHHLDNVFGPTLARSNVLLSVSIESPSTMKEHRGWIVPTLLGSDADVGTGEAWGQLNKALDLNQTKDWLNFCDQNHMNDCRMPRLDTIPFFRLIDCATRSIVDAPD